MEVKRYKTPKEVAIQFAKFLANQVGQVDNYSVALSGGSTPKLLFQVLADDFADVLNWEHLHLYWGDERCVEPKSSESNYGVTNNILLKSLTNPPHVHRIIGENDPEAEAQRYSTEIESTLKTYKGLPQFDMIILGMGDDGHTASIFPDQMELLHSDKICSVASHPVSGQKRVTLTGKVINNAKTVVFLVTGESKAGRIREIHYKEDGSESFPATHINPANGQLIWFMDENASRYLV